MTRGARALLVVAVMLATWAAAFVGGRRWAGRDVTHQPCPTRGTLVLADSRAGVLCLCRNGRLEGRYRAAFGRHGTGKRVAGDGRTPLGDYPLGPARPSTRFHVFIPIAYPTPAQRAKGLTGSAVGIHGPHRGLRWLGRWSAGFNWTGGCIAVGADADLDRIAAWVRETQARVVVIV